MNEFYYLRELSRDEINSMFDKLTEIWDISNHYWFPLYDTNVNSVIAFDSVAFESHFGFVKLREILNDINEIIEIRESRYKGYIVKLESFEPSYESIGEGYWFDENMNWIIYCSHEGSTTFGGEWLINSIKNDWNDWEKHIFYVTQ
ncbi:hypothetical protein [Paenibacillus sedimenti]|nr:hypothetical protein [Paenibacillus sedimenti]